MSLGDPELIEAAAEHFDRSIPGETSVFHETLSPEVHIDVHIKRATPERNFHVLMTSGMAERPMTPPPEFERCRHAELCIALPPTWRLAQDEFSDERNYWPIRVLKMLARYPHRRPDGEPTWLWGGHTISVATRGEKFLSGTAFTAALLRSPGRALPKEFGKFTVPDGRDVRVFCIMPLYEEELQHHLEKREPSLKSLLDRSELSEVIDVHRSAITDDKPRAVPAQRRSLWKRLLGR